MKHSHLHEAHRKRQFKCITDNLICISNNLDHVIKNLLEIENLKPKLILNASHNIFPTFAINKMMEKEEKRDNINILIVERIRQAMENTQL